MELVEVAVDLVVHVGHLRCNRMPDREIDLQQGVEVVGVHGRAPVVTTGTTDD